MSSGLCLGTLRHVSDGKQFERSVHSQQTDKIQTNAHREKMAKAVSLELNGQHLGDGTCDRKLYDRECNEVQHATQFTWNIFRWIYNLWSGPKTTYDFGESCMRSKQSSFSICDHECRARFTIPDSPGMTKPCVHRYDADE